MGVDLEFRSIVTGFLSFPHTRGGGPVAARMAATKIEFSPHAWGWTGPPWHPARVTGVFPTRVGVDLVNRLDILYWLRFPHTRGGGPNLDIQ